jgi:magnesium transporter
MKISWYQLNSGELQERTISDGWQKVINAGESESWFDVDQGTPEELHLFLNNFNLHPVQIARCVDSINDPASISFGNTLLIEYPTSLDEKGDEPGYLSIILSESYLVTIRHGPIPVLDNLIGELIAKGESLRHLPQVVYLILDEFADMNVDAQIEVRDQILQVSERLSRQPNVINIRDLSTLRWKVDRLISLIENQLYCISGLNASDNISLKEPHRKAYIQDLLSEAEIAQRGVYRLENRLNSLYNEFQMAGSDLVEKRLRFLTILSAITLPLGLIAGLLGMNVGGLPGTTFRYGFLAVIVLMVIIGGLQFWYFKKNGWFD